MSTDTCKESVFQNIHKKHAAELRNFALLRGMDVSKANDVVQEAFLKLWKNCKKVRPEAARSYMYTIVRNTMINIHNKAKLQLKYRKQISHKTVEYQDGQFQLEESEFRQQLLRAIDDLSERQRTVFLMHRIEQHSYKEIAQSLDISVKTVEKHMHLALEKLHHILKNWHKG